MFKSNPNLFDFDLEGQRNCEITLYVKSKCQSKSMLNIQFIDQSYQLELLYSRIRSATFVAIDTEFHSENKYIPDLMLVQISIQRGEVFLIDALAGLNLDPLGRLLNKKIIITHGGREDYRLLYRELGLRAARAFDTQIMAGFIGWHFPMRFDTLLERSVGIQLSKGSTMSNWRQRPLSTEQLNYAAEDANQLLSIFYQLRLMLQEQDKFQLAERASIEYMESALMPKIPEEIWPYWSIAESMDTAQRNTLNNLVRWRESLAMDLNRSSNAILPQGIIIDIARRMPTSTEGILENRKISRSRISKYGNYIMQCIKLAQKDRTEFQVLTSEGRRTSKIIQFWTIAAANQLQIDSSLLLSERQCHQIALHGPEDSLVGWRRDLLLPIINIFLSGQTAIQISPNGPNLIDCDSP